MIILGIIGLFGVASLFPLKESYKMPLEDQIKELNNKCKNYLKKLK